MVNYKKRWCMKRVMTLGILIPLFTQAMQQPLPLRPHDIVIIEIQEKGLERPQNPSPRRVSPRTPVRIEQIKSSTKVKIASLAALTSLIGSVVVLTIHFTQCK